MTLTGRQIREARKLLGWSRVSFGRATSLPVDLVTAVESFDGEAWLSEEQERAIRRAFADGGAEFVAEDGDGPGVRLRKREAS